jgi:transposase-like protein
MDNFDFNKFEKEAIESLKDGQGLLGRKGVLTPLLKRFLEKALEAELDHHLDEDERNTGNRRNGSSKKQIKSTSGPVDLKTHRDRKSNFEPKIIGKRELYLGEDLEEKIIKLYARGMSYSDIQAHLSEIYDLDVSSGKLSQITDKVIPELEACGSPPGRSRPLEALYPIVYLDAIHFKVRENGHVVSKAMYNVLAIRTDGHKELLGLYLGENEGAGCRAQSFGSVS